MALSRKQQSKRPLFVHLGNIGPPEFPAEKTARYAKRFPKVDFVGIDIGAVGKTPKNWRQIEAGFIEGLKKLKDNSANGISSEMALGYYPVEALGVGTMNAVKLCFKKLKPGGKLMIVATSGNFSLIMDSLFQAGFSSGKTKARPFTEKEYERTYWTRNFRQVVMPVIEKMRHSDKLFQIIAQK